jgi:hypothetical protein
MEPAGGRRTRSTDRVSIVIQVQIFGSDLEGLAYTQEAHTLEVSRGGALIQVMRHLTPEEEVVIRRERAGKEAHARIVGQVREGPEGIVYGVKLLDTNINLWDINFLPLSESGRAVGRTLLECAKCRLREVIYLEEFETEVYNANGFIYHSCKRCRQSTIWKEAAHEAAERDAGLAAPPPPPPPPEPEPGPRLQNERRHNRVRCNLQACIRYKQFFEEEVLEVSDVSRGGICFLTRKYLAPGTRIEIALPYSPGMANIFVPAEIVRLRPLPNKNLYECGAAYLKRS